MSTPGNNLKLFDQRCLDYAERLPAAINEVHVLWRILVDNEWDLSTFYKLKNQVHRLAGTGRSYGFGNLSYHASILEHLFHKIERSDYRFTESDQALVEDNIAGLKESSREPDCESAFPVTAEPTQGTADELVYIVDDDEDSSRYYEVVLQSAGYTTTVFHDLGEFQAALESEQPDIIIMDIVFPEGNMAGVDAISELRSSIGEDTPIIFTSVRSDLLARVEALRAGGCHYLAKPVEPAALLGIVSNNSRKRRPAPRILLVDDDPTFVLYCETLLKDNDYEVLSTTEPQHTIDFIESFRPDAVIIDHHMPEYNGDELIRLLRQDERYGDIPVLIVTADGQSVLKDSITGINDAAFLQKPVNSTALLESLSGLLQTTSPMNRGVMKTLNRNLHGVVELEYYYSELESIIATARNGAHPYILLYLAIDDRNLIRERVGIKQLNRLNIKITRFLASLVGKNELISQINEFKYLVLMRPHDHAHMKSNIDHLRHTLAAEIFDINGIDISVTASIGAIPITPRINSVDEAVRIAEQASMRASQNGGNQEVIEISAQDAGRDADHGVGLAFMESCKNDGLRLLYQPIVNIESAESFYESFARFHTSDSILTPAQFMPYIEEYDLSFEFNKMVIVAAINDILRSTGKCAESSVTIIVKIEPCYRTMSEILPWFEDYLESHDIRLDGRLIMGFRENWIMQNQTETRLFMERARSLGCELSIDHAGSSKYSADLVEALSPVLVKLAPEMVSSLVSHTPNDALEKLRAMQSKGVNIVAGEVEDADHITRLMAIGIKQFQGYFVQQPDSELDFTLSNYDM